MAKLFYLKLAWTNVKRNRLTYVPYLLSIALMSGFFLLIVGLIKSETLANVPSGDAAQSMFKAGLIIFALLTIFFMLYINNFLVNRRKREFGLYSILGLDKRHISRVLAFENAIVTFGGLILGTAFALVFGYLLFLILLKMLSFVGDSSFSLPPTAFILTYILFAAIFVVSTVWNSIRVRALNSMTLLQSEKRGERPSKLMIPAAILGLGMLVYAYYQAWTIDNPAQAIVMFLLLVVFVIVATFLLFSSGSTLLITILRRIKGYYYKPKNFVSLSGMFHRMRQNARGLSFICILSTMLVVTVAGTFSLYVGRERIYREQHPYDVITEVFASSNEVEANTIYSEFIHSEADKLGLTIHASADKLTTDPAYSERGNYVFEPSETRMINGMVYANRELMFDVYGDVDDCQSLIVALQQYDGSGIEGYNGLMVHEIFTERQQGLGLYGGLLFLGAFFGVLFLAMTVLIIYFKQVTEGYEDKQRFIILQQVGMDKKMVKGAINRQIQWMFLLPLVTTLLHMLFASKIMSRMLILFQLYDWWLVLACIGCVCVVFILIYLLVFRLTARAYYKIVAFENN